MTGKPGETVEIESVFGIPVSYRKTEKGVFYDCPDGTFGPFESSNRASFDAHKRYEPGPGLFMLALHIMMALFVLFMLIAWIYTSPISFFVVLAIVGFFGGLLWEYDNRPRLQVNRNGSWNVVNSKHHPDNNEIDRPST